MSCCADALSQLTRAFVGMNPQEARRFHKTQLELNEDFTEEMQADAGIWPKLDAVHRMYAAWRKETYGDREGPSILDSLSKKKNQYLVDGCLIDFTEEPFAVVMVTPLMRRIHQHENNQDVK